jgi:Protein of unknown function (DUF664)
MKGAEILIEAFGRIRDRVHQVTDGLTPDQAAVQLDREANSIAWLIWHLSRIQDDHVTDAAGTEQVWTSQGWAERYGLPFSDTATGYGHGPQDVRAVRVASMDLLTGYHDAVYERTVRYIQGLGDGDFNRVVDESWDPPVTLGVRLISVIADCLQHAGQAAFARGIIERGEL